MSTFLYSHWLAISLSDRIQLAHKLGIKKSRSTHVSNNVVVDDGFNIKDVELGLTVENLQKITGSISTDTKVLLDEAVRGLQPIGKMEVIMPSAPIAIEVKKKRGRPSKIK